MGDNNHINWNKARTNQRKNGRLSAVAAGFMEGNVESEIDAAAFIFPITVACRLGPMSATDFGRHGVTAGSTGSIGSTVSDGSSGCGAGRAFIGGYRRARLRCLGGLVRDNRLDLAFE